MTAVFWTAAAFIFYVYIGYPLILWLIGKCTRADSTPSLPDSDLPTVTVIVSARNEARTISRRIQNFLDQDYPLDKMEIIIVSDGSSDDTAAIVRSIATANQDGNIKKIAAIELPDNHGKPHALNLAVAQATHDILIMADARQVFAVDAIRHLVNSLSNPSTGCVSGELLLEASADGESAGVEMGIYWTYERFIRRRESRIASVVGMTGAIYAIRRELYETIPEDTLIDDVLIPMNVVRKGFRARFNSSAIAYDTPSTSPSQEWRRKVRTMAGNWQMLRDHHWLMSPLGNPLFLQYFSHKTGRLLVPFALLATLVSSMLIATTLYRVFAALEVLGLLLGLSGVLIPAARKFRIVSLAYFFLLLNASVLVGLSRSLKPGTGTLWTDAHKGQ